MCAACAGCTCRTISLILLPYGLAVSWVKYVVGFWKSDSIPVCDSEAQKPLRFRGERCDVPRACKAALDDNLAPRTHLKPENLQVGFTRTQSFRSQHDVAGNDWHYS